MSKKNMIALIAGLTVLAVALIGATCVTVQVWKHFSDYSTALKANWGFSLPSDAQYSEVYSKDEGSSFHGDGIRYHIFTYREPGPIREMLPWQTEASAYSEAVNTWLEEIAVPSEQLPPLAQCRFWHASQEDGSEIIVLWDENGEKLYIAESFL